MKMKKNTFILLHIFYLAYSLSTSTCFPRKTKENVRVVGMLLIGVSVFRLSPWVVLEV